MDTKAVPTAPLNSQPGLAGSTTAGHRSFWGACYVPRYGIRYRFVGKTRAGCVGRQHFTADQFGRNIAEEGSLWC